VVEMLRLIEWKSLRITIVFMATRSWHGKD
jgi:hypothetical protein